MGTIIRTADWFGINRILCGAGCADLYNPKVLQATMGSIIRVNIQYTNLVDWCSQNDDIPLYGCTLSGTSVYQFNVPDTCIIVMGNELKVFGLNYCRSVLHKSQFHVLAEQNR